MTMDEHDERADEAPDPALDRAWREASRERPSGQLDAAILAASRRAVEEQGSRHPTNVSHPRPRRWFTRVQPYAAAASVAALAFVLVQTLPRDVTSTAPMPRAPSPASAQPSQDTRESIVPQRSPPRSATPNAAQEGDLARPRANPMPAQDRLLERQREMPAPGVNSQEATTGVPADTGTGTETGERSATIESAPRRGTFPAAGVAAPASAAKADASSGSELERDARARAERIAELFASGETMAAVEALHEFRSAYPDADAWLAPDVREWARTIE